MSLRQLSTSGVFVTNVGAEAGRCIEAVCGLKRKCFFGRGKKNFTVMKVGCVLVVSKVALAFSIASLKAAAKESLLGALGFQSLTRLFPAFVVAKFRNCGRGMPSILHLKALECSVTLNSTAVALSKWKLGASPFAQPAGGIAEEPN